MGVAYDELVCPAGEKYWEQSLTELPPSRETFDCPDGGERRPLTEFAQLDRDLEVLRDSHCGTGRQSSPLHLLAWTSVTSPERCSTDST